MVLTWYFFILIFSLSSKSLVDESIYVSFLRLVYKDLQSVIITCVAIFLDLPGYGFYSGNSKSLSSITILVLRMWLMN